ncbi:hypothetical protein M8J76_014118 [Diaphorina citri]|nr:hypothetical protein M8J75_015003 [Diaphorina citri]KAI5719738.1 hypothetical protein M8J76_014118 [Diaphorina citri]KAI5721829.1 hypothetical protein M8J77_026237 [Diaphorina citri]
MPQGKTKVKAKLPAGVKGKSVLRGTYKKNRPVQAKKNKNQEAAKIQRAISKNVNKAIEEELRSRAISKEKPHLSTKRNHPPEPKPAQVADDE